jgi:GNAT superfamily N-acetyltransferase
MIQTQVVGAGLVLRRAGDADAGALSGMLMSLPELSLYMRFQTAIGKPPRPALLQQLVCPNGAAFVAERDGRLVGHAMWAWVAGAAVPTAELALIIAGPEQRRGLGTRLLTEAAQHASGAGADRFLLMISALNDQVLRMARRRWPSARAERDGCLLNFTIPATGFFATAN